MPLSDAQLQGIAAQALNMAKLDLQRDRFNFLLAFYIEAWEHRLKRMGKLEALIIEKLGENWLNSGRTKDLGFDGIRKCVDLAPPDAVVIVTVANKFYPTAKFRELSEAEQEELVTATHDRHHEAVKQGLFSMYDVLWGTAQTPERICLVHQKIRSGGTFIDKPEMHCGPQEDFGGRIKMFGEDHATERKARTAR
jgi:hypothetical protein